MNKRLHVHRLIGLVFAACLGLPGPCSTARAGLEPAPSSNPDHWPYRDAVLTVTNPSDMTATAVQVRWQSGGPTLRFHVLAPPKATVELPVMLPALQPVQTFDVSLQTSPETPAPPLTLSTSSVDWPEDGLSPDAFIDPGLAGSLPTNDMTWPSRLRWGLLAGGAIYACLVAGVLLPRMRPAHRLTAAVLGLALLTAVLWQLWPTLSQQVAIDRVDDLIILRARRTTVMHLPTQADGKIIRVPVYFSRNQFRNDDTLILPDGTARFTVRPDLPRLFRHIDHASPGSP